MNKKLKIGKRENKWSFYLFIISSYFWAIFILEFNQVPTLSLINSDYSRYPAFVGGYEEEEIKI